MKKRIISLLLAVVMIVGMIPLGAITAFADGGNESTYVGYGEARKDYYVADNHGTYFTGDYKDSVFKADGYNKGDICFENMTFENITSDGYGSCVYINLGFEVTIDWTITFDNSGMVVFNNCKFINCSSSKNGGVIYINNSCNSCRVIFNDCTIENCTSEGNGGVIYTNDKDALVEFNNTTINGCSAKNGGGIYMNSGYKVTGKNCNISDCKATSGNGGFIYTNDNDAEVRFDNSDITRCSATYGGAMYMNAGYIFSTENSNISDCKATENGGFIYTNDKDAEITLTDSVISGCSAKNGGGIYMNSGYRIFAEGTVISDCSASEWGGFFYSNDEDAEINYYESTDADNHGYTLIAGCSAQYGGGIYAANITLVQNCIFSDNKATYDGGGIYNYTGTDHSSKIYNCRFYRNIAGDDSNNKRYGGGLYVANKKGYIINCQFFENEAYNSGADVWSTTYLQYCTFTTRLEDHSEPSSDVYESQRSECIYKNAEQYSLTELKGRGTAENPYEIWTVDDWDVLYYAVLEHNKLIMANGPHFILKHDIVATSPLGLWTGDANTARPFKGNFDGNGKTIRFACSSDKDNNAPFNYTVEATVKNLTVSGFVKGRSGAAGIIAHAEGGCVDNCINLAKIKGSSYAGGIIGYSSGTAVRNCIGAANIYSGDFTGGIVGCATDTEVTNCKSTGNINGAGYVGGIVGHAENTDIKECSSKAKVTATGQWAGGISGWSKNSNFEDCVNYGDVLGSDNNVGGISGRSYYDKFTNCMNHGNVSGKNNVAGICGRATESEFIISTNYGDVKATNSKAGGIIGDTDGATKLINGISSGNITARQYAGGIIGYEETAVTVKNCHEIGKVTAILPNEGEYTISLASDSKSFICADNSDGYTVGKTAGTAKHFTFIYDAENDCYYIKDKQTDKYLAVATGGMGKVYQSEMGIYLGLRWTFEDAGNGDYYIKSPWTGYCMWINPYSNNTVYTFTSSDKTKLRLTTVSDGTVIFSGGITGHCANGSVYENCFYNKEKCFADSHGVGLSENAINGVSADIIEGIKCIFPDVVNNKITENGLFAEGYNKMFFDSNKNPCFYHSISGSNITSVWDSKDEEEVGYWVTESITFDERIAVNGNVRLLIEDGATLDAKSGITLEDGNTLSVYGVSDNQDEMGLLKAIGTNGNAAIGGRVGANGRDGDGRNGTKRPGCYDGYVGEKGTNCGTLRVFGAHIIADGEVGIGGGCGGNGGTAGYDSVYNSAGGKGGKGGSGGTLEIYGGVVDASGTGRAVGGGSGGNGGQNIVDHKLANFAPNGDVGTKTNVTIDNQKAILRLGNGISARLINETDILNSQKIFRSEGCKLIPVESVEAIRGAYINTVYIPTEKTRIVMDVDVRSSSECWFGVWDVSDSEKAFGLSNDKNGVYAAYGNQGITDSDGAVKCGNHTVELNKNKVYIDGIERTTVELTDSTDGFPISNYLYLFSQNRNGEAYTDGSVTFRSAQIYEGDTLLHDYVPMYNSIGRFCVVYDKVEKVIFETPQGYLSGDSSNFFEFSDSTVVESNAYFDTGLTFSNNDNIKVVMDVDVQSNDEEWFGVSYLKSGDNQKWSNFGLKNTPQGVCIYNGLDGAYQDTSVLSLGRHTVSLSNGVATVDGRTIESNNHNTPSTGPATLYLFGRNMYKQSDGCGTLQKTNKVIFYSCQIYNGNTLLHDYAPVKIIRTAEPMIYDFVTKELLSYSGDEDDVLPYNMSEHCWRNAEKDRNGVSTLKYAANCIKNAVYYQVCAICGEASTTKSWEKPNSTTAHSYKYDSETHHKCAVCGKTEKHTVNKNGVCEMCQTNLLSYFPENPAACETAGHLAYYYNEHDGKYYKDVGCTQQIEDIETWLAVDGGGYLKPLGHRYKNYDKINHKCEICGSEENHIYDAYGNCQNCESIIFTENVFSGNGTENEPYIIGSAQDLALFAFYVDSGYDFDGIYFKLTADNLTVTKKIGNWANDNSKRFFSGVFDGNNKTIHLDLQEIASNNALFSFTVGATVKNLTVDGIVKGHPGEFYDQNLGIATPYFIPVINGNSGAAGIVAHAENTTVDNCTNHAEINAGDYSGGIMGYAGDGTVIRNCGNYAAITGRWYIGGILGAAINNSKATVLIENCINIANVKTYSFGNYLGGISGDMRSCGTVKNCLTEGCVSYNVEILEHIQAVYEGYRFQPADYAGIVIGGAGGSFSIENCYYNIKRVYDGNTNTEQLICRNHAHDYLMHGVSGVNDANMIASLNSYVVSHDGCYYWNVRNGKVYFTEKELYDGKQEAKAAIDEATGQNPPAEIKEIADKAKADIDNADDLSSIAAIKKQALADIANIKALYTAKQEAKAAIDKAVGSNTTLAVKSLANSAKVLIDGVTESNGVGIAKIKAICNEYISAIQALTDTGHTHTFADTYTHNDTHHWHEATCGHDVVFGFAAHTFTVVTNDDGSKTCTCECGYTKVVYDKPVDEGEIITGISYTGISLTLGSDISINFYMELSDEARQNGKMTFNIGGRIVTVDGKDAKYNETEKKYYFQTPLNVLEMAETVTATFTYNGIDYVQEYSVAEYIESIIGNPDKYGKEAVALAKKIANYGYYAQVYLASIHSNVQIVDSGEGYDRMFKFGGDFDIDVEKAIEALKNYSVTVSGTSDNLSLYGSTVYFDAATALNYYVTVKNGEEPTAKAVNTVTGEEKQVEIKLYKGNIYIVSVKDITATELADDITVTINDEITLTGSVFAYCNSVVSAHSFDGATEKDNFAVNAMAAFYEYYTEACEYANRKIFKDGYLYFTCDAPDVKKVSMSLYGIDDKIELTDIGDGIFSDDGYLFDKIGYVNGRVTFTVIGESSMTNMPYLDVYFDEADCAPMIVKITGLTDENYAWEIKKLK